MRLPRIQFTVRRIMGAVVVVTVLLYACVLTVRIARYLTLARQYQADVVMYSELERISLEKLDDGEKHISELSRQAADAEGRAAATGTSSGIARAESDYASDLRALVALREGRQRLEREDATRYSMMRRRSDRLVAKYRHAARQPWLLIEPDPPEPG